MTLSLWPSRTLRSRLGAPRQSGHRDRAPRSIHSPSPGSGLHQPWSRCNAPPRPPGCPRAGTALAASRPAGHDGAAAPGSALCAPGPARPAPPGGSARPQLPRGPAGDGPAPPALLSRHCPAFPVPAQLPWCCPARLPAPVRLPIRLPRSRPRSQSGSPAPRPGPAPGPAPAAVSRERQLERPGSETAPDTRPQS